MSQVEVILSANGQTAVFEDGIQIPELQESWLLIFARWLMISAHADPRTFNYTLPNNVKAKLVGSLDNLNWEIER